MSTLYVSDLDGTLLTNTARLSDCSRATLRDLLKRIATHVIGSNEEDSLVRYIDAHWRRAKTSGESSGD